MRLFTLVIALLTLLTRIAPQSGALHVPLWLAKLLATAFSWPLSLLNGAMAFIGIKRRDWLMIGAGGAGAATTAVYLSRLIRSRDQEFTAVFGSDWQMKIPPAIASKLRKRRWQPLFYRPIRGAVGQDIVYGVNPDSGKLLRADILEPPDGTPRSGLALIYMHGGSWTLGRKNIRKFPYFRQLAEQGHLVMDIDYTLAPQTSIIGMVGDVKRAILWLKAHAETYGVNPERVMLAGQSAGGHLALLAAYTPNLPAFQPRGSDGQDTAVCGVISYYGPPDMEALYNDIAARFNRLLSSRVNQGIQDALKRTKGKTRTRLVGNMPDDTPIGGGIAGLMGGRPDQIPDIYRLLSPIVHVDADCPPTLLLHGEHDFLVSAREVERLHQALLREGAQSVYLSFPGCDHSFESMLPQISPAAQAAAYYTERFVALMV